LGTEQSKFWQRRVRPLRGDQRSTKRPHRWNNWYGDHRESYHESNCSSEQLVGTTSAAVPNFFEGRLTVCSSSCNPNSITNPANLTNPFNLTFSNGGDTVSRQLSLSGQGEIPFVNSVTLSGTPQAPVFSWTPPPGTTVEGYRINIYQNNLETF